jgi:alpha-beta hydrolase superfamily lysophospholipase
METWSEDVLGEDFRSLALPVGVDDEGERFATLVAFEPAGTVSSAGASGPVRPDRAVLYLPGYSDYFLHRDLARAVHREGWAFFALDLHKYGRSLRPGQTPGFTTSLEEYDADLEAAIEALSVRLAERCGTGTAGAPPPAPDLVVMAHSLGGLTASLWAARHPGRLAGLILNGPWLDTRGSALLRTAAQGVFDTVSRLRPKARLRLPELGFYFRSISNTRDGEWPIDPVWRPESGFPIRAGWLAAVLRGHAALARGVTVDAPVLVLASATSTISPTWSEAMLVTDSVLDVGAMVRRAAELGSHVTIRRFTGALHDVFLSRGNVREEAVDVVVHWLRALPAGAGPPEHPAGAHPPVDGSAGADRSTAPP